MKLLLQILLGLFLIFILWISFWATVGILLRLVVTVAFIAIIIAVLRHLIAGSRKEKTFDSKTHERHEKEAEKKLQEMERNINQ